MECQEFSQIQKARKCKKPTPEDRLFCIGAGEAIRTPDPNLGKVMLYP